MIKQVPKKQKLSLPTTPFKKVEDTTDDNTALDELEKLLVEYKVDYFPDTTNPEIVQESLSRNGVTFIETTSAPELTKIVGETSRMLQPLFPRSSLTNNLSVLSSSLNINSGAGLRTKGYVLHQIGPMVKADVGGPTSTLVDSNPINIGPYITQDHYPLLIEIMSKLGKGTRFISQDCAVKIVAAQSRNVDVTPPHIDPHPADRIQMVLNVIEGDVRLGAVPGTHDPRIRQLINTIEGSKDIFATNAFISLKNERLIQLMKKYWTCSQKPNTLLIFQGVVHFEESKSKQECKRNEGPCLRFFIGTQNAEHFRKEFLQDTVKLRQESIGIDPWRPPSLMAVNYKVDGKTSRFLQQRFLSEEDKRIPEKVVKCLALNFDDLPFRDRKLFTNLNLK